MKTRSIIKASVLYAMMLFGVVGIPAQSLSQTYVDNDRVWSNNDPTINSRRSEHFRVVWGNGQNPATSSQYSLVTEQMVQGNLQAFEHAWHLLHDPFPAGAGLPIPNQSIDPAYQDGKLYRDNFQFTYTGIDASGGTGTVDDYGFPWFGGLPKDLRYDPSPDASLHEYIHTILTGAGGFTNTPYDGYWHESTDGWIGTLSYWYAVMDGYAVFHNLTLPHGRCQYDSWLLPAYMYENPTYGASFMSALWQQAHGNDKKYTPPEYMFDAMVRLHPAGEPDPYNAIKDCIGKMSAHNVTWDYRGKQYYRLTTPYVIDGSPFNFRIRRGTTELFPQPGASGWYRVPFEHAPCQGGYNICPIELVGKTGGGYTVGVNLQPLWDAQRKSDWRACLVAVNSAGDARYSTIWNSGVNSITLSADENTLYLVVAATPDFVPFNAMPGPLMTTDAAAAPQAYRVQFVGTDARPYLISRKMTGGGAPHVNGGGWVASGAHVDATAYVGPNAIVGDRAQVLGYARIEDYAQIMTDAQVRDNAVVSGHAVVKDSAQVYGNAKIRDWATVDANAQVYENARVIEHACLGGHVKYFGNAIIKGCAQDYDFDDNNIPEVNGCAIKEGDCTNYASMAKGVLTGCVYGRDLNRINALPDNNYLYCAYRFDRTSRNYAIDEYGLVYGYLLGNPLYANGGATNRGSVLSFDGVDDYIELPYGVSDFDDFSVAAWVKWNGGTADQKIFSFGDGSNKYIYLTPKDASTGKLRLKITDGTTTQYLDGTGALPANVWTHVAVTLNGDTGILYVNGTPVNTNAGMTLNPDNCNGANVAAAGNWNFIGRGNTAEYFAGQIDEFRVYYKALSSTEINAIKNLEGGTLATSSDSVAPQPNAATWLAMPSAAGTESVVMSATKGTDASNYVEYYFDCIEGPGHDSGWISSNRYYDCDLAQGSTYTYIVKMRDKAGNITAPSIEASVTLPTDTSAPTPGTATFLVGPAGISSSAIKMTATPGTDASPLIEYKFDRVSPTTATSGWQASNIWTDTGLASNTVYGYCVQMRDAYGNVGAVSAVSTASAKDTTPPTRYTYGEWSTMPYSTVDNCVAMRARSVTGNEILSCNIANETVQYYFHCTTGNGPDSGWLSTNVWKSSALRDGTYSYQFKMRDAIGNETPYSSVETAKVGPTTGYHAYAFSQLSALPDDYLASFSGVVVQSNYDNYLVKDIASNTTIKVMPAVFGPTDPAKVFKNVRVEGHLRTIGTRYVSFANVTVTGTPTSFPISGKVTTLSGIGLSGATVYCSATPNASSTPSKTATTDANGNYTLSVPNGIWYVAAVAPGYSCSADRVVTVNNAMQYGINFSLNVAHVITASAEIGGTITPSGSVYVSNGANQTFVFTPDAGYKVGMVNVDGVNIGAVPSYTFSNVTRNHDISVVFSLSRNIPRPNDLLFSCITDTLPASGETGAWKSFLPAGQLFSVKNTPTAEEINGIKWEKNVYSDKDGYDVGAFDAPVAVNGVSIIVAIKPMRSSDTNNWRSIVDLFYDRLVLGIRNDTGVVCVRRNSNVTTWAPANTAIPNGQTTILSLICQPSGTYKVFANGNEIMNVATTSTMTSLVPFVAGAYANHFNIGRNDPDDWSIFNGNIGDVFVYKVALTDAERRQLEADLTSRFAPPSGQDVSSISALKAKTNGAFVRLTGTSTITYAPVSAGAKRTTLFFYIGETQGMGGLKVVDKTSDSLKLGDQVQNLTGYVRKPANGEVYLELTSDTVGTTGTAIKPIGATCRTILEDSSVLTNAVVTWGKVMSFDGLTTFTIDDGFGTPVNVKINGVALPSDFNNGKTAIVTGVVGTDRIIHAQKIQIGR